MIEYPNLDKLVEKNLNHDLPVYRKNHPLLPKHIFRMAFIGASHSGKGNLLLNMLLNLIDYDTLHIISETHDGINELFKKLAEKNDTIKFYSDPQQFDLQTLDPKQTNVVVFDDICHNSKVQDIISACFSLGRHHSCSVIYLSQSYFKLPVFLRNNCTNFLIFRLGQDSEFQKLHSRLASDLPIEVFKKMYKEAVKENKYGFLYINLLGEKPIDKYKNRFDKEFSFLQNE